MRQISGIIGSIAGIALSLSSSVQVHAASLCPTGQFNTLCNLKLENSPTLVGRIVTVMLIFGVVLALFFLILGGIRWIMSGGDKAKVESARGTITAAIVGLVLAFLAFFFLNVIMYLFTGKGITTFTIPTLF